MNPEPSQTVESHWREAAETAEAEVVRLKRSHRVSVASVQAQQVFMANMSHEIRTPLHGVMGLAELLKKEPLSTVQADYVQMIQSSTENLLVVINDILEFTRIESGNISLENIPFDILKTVHEATRSLAFKARSKGLELRLADQTGELPLTLGDPFRLHQVLINLIGNAIKFTPHGVITIAVTAVAHPAAGAALPVTFSVTDTGIGIGADSMGHIFSSFRQADSSIPRLYGGTGLGLSICKTLVELQGGQIGARSEPGQGSCFSFTIPYRRSAEPVPAVPAVPPSSDLLRGLRILLAEDNAVNQLIAGRLLMQWQVKVDLAHDGEEALAKAAECPYDLILMDIQMPQLDGLEAIARLRAEASLNRATPVIALTADAMRINADSYRALGFTNYLTKPYRELELYNMIAQVSQRAPVAPAGPALYYDFLLLGRLATDTVFIRKMLELFTAHVPAQVRALQSAVADENWPAVAREAHSLKSTFGSLNIQPETTHLKQLEELAERSGPRSGFEPLLAAVISASPRYCALFLHELAQLPRAGEG